MSFVTLRDNLPVREVGSHQIATASTKRIARTKSRLAATGTDVQQNTGRGLYFSLFILALCWFSLALLLFTHALWDTPSGITDVIPDFYHLIGTILPPGWVGASRETEPAHIIAATLYFILTCTLWLLFFNTLRLLGKQQNALSARRMFALILGVSLIFNLSTLFWPGLFSVDVFEYAGYGRMQVVHGLNPLSQTPAMMGDDPWLQYIWWKDIHSPYGPIWNEVTALVSMFAEGLSGSKFAYLFGFKVLNILFLGISTALLWAIGGQLNWSTSRRAVSTALFAWCPLLVIELAGNSHNDAMLIMFVLAAVWLHLRGLWPLAIAAFVLAGLVKLPGFFFLPAYCMLLLRIAASSKDAAKRVVLGATIGGAVLLISYLPYPASSVSAPSQAEIGWFAASPTTVLRWGFADIAVALRGTFFPADITQRQALELARWPLWYGAFGLWTAIAALVSLRVRSFETLLRAWFVVIFAYLLIAATSFQPWYITWLLPVLALLPYGPRTRAGLLLALGGTMLYAIVPHLPGDSTDNLRNYYIPAIIFLPTLIYCLATIRNQRRLLN